MNCINLKWHHKWQRSECGWKCFNLCTYNYIETNILLISFQNNWSYVDSLGLNACKWVALRTGMNLFLWCGLVLFRLDETTNICMFDHIYIYKTLVIMKWFHLTCCDKKKRYICIYNTSCICIYTYR